MCLSPVTILNPSKYVSVKYRDRFLLQVPCGKCAECQSAKSNEYLYRSYHEFLQCFENQGFAYFDTLTYNDEYLPRLSDLCQEFPKIPCFNSRHITLFIKKLRIHLERKYNVTIRYFLSAEYGARYGRPHYHMLLFVYGYIDALDLSQLVSSLWQYGRTDGYPYKSALYVQFHNVVNSRSGQSVFLRTANYVAKYVQKNCFFQASLDSRIRKCDLILDSDIIDSRLKLQGVSLSRLRIQLKDSVNQFHLQSLHYGETALRDMDINQIIRDGFLLMPHHQCIKMPIPIPTYYKRKLFYELYSIHSSKTWQLNELGKKYRAYRMPYNRELLSSRLSCAAELIGVKCDTDELADYVLNHRGRYRGEYGESTLVERIDDLTHYPYLTSSDKEAVGIGISLSFVGNSALGYEPIFDGLSVRGFIDKYVYLDSQKEVLLERLYNVLRPFNDGKQKAFALNQRLTELYKSLLS